MAPSNHDCIAPGEFLKGIPSAFAVAGFGVILLGGTIALLRQENGKFAALIARRDALAQQLKAGG